MAESKETVIFEIDVSSYEKSLAELTKSIGDLKTQQKDLQQQTKAGVEGAAQAYEKVTAQLKIQQQQYRTNQNVLVGYTAAQQKGVDTTNFMNNSIQGNRDLLKQLTAEYIKTKNPSEQFTAKIKQLSDALKQQEAAIGDTRRNVGNYAAGFKEAIGGIISGVPALKGFQTAQLGVNAAMNANPVGAVIMLFTGLVEIFKNNAEVADQVSFAIDGLTKGFNFIIDTVVNTVTSLDNLTKALRNPIGFVIDLAKGTAQAAKEGYEASKALDAFELSAGRYDRAIQKNQISVDALTKSLKDRTKGEQERIKIANQIADLEIKNADLLVKKNQELLNAETLRLKGKSLTASEQNKLEQLQTDVQNAEAEKRIVNAQRQTRINILLEKELTAAKKEEATKRVELEKDERIKIAQEQDKARKEAEQKRLADRSKQYTEQVNLLNLIAENDIKQTELIVKNREEAERQINDIKIRSLEKQLDLAIQFLGEDGDITQEELEGIRAIELAIKKLREGATKPPAKGKTFGESIGVSKEQQDEIAAGLRDVSQIVGSIQGLVNTGFEARNNEIENNKNAEIAAIEATSKSREEKDAAIRESEKKAAQKTYELQKQQFEFNKAISIVQTIINTAQAIIAQLSNPTPYVGFVLSALAAATGAAQIAVIASQKPPPPPKFATGIIGLDGAGTETSDSIDAKLSRGESVITAKATRRFHRELAYMEAAVGNTPNYNFSSGKFATGVIGTGGFATRDINNNAEQAAIMRASIIEGFANAPQPVVAVKEINKVNKGLTRSVAVSEL